MVVVAIGVIFDFVPAWAPQSGASGSDFLTLANKALPIGSSLVGAVFIIAIFRRWAAKGGTHLLVWGIGLVFFATGSFTEALHGLLGWHDSIFRFWYLFGAVLIAAWMGQGTVHLLAPVRWARMIGALLSVASLYAAYQVFTATLEPRLLASDVTAMATDADATADEVLAGAAALLAPTGLDQRGQPDRRRLTPLARTVASAAGRRGVSVPSAVLTESEHSLNLVGTVGDSQWMLGTEAWLAQHGAVSGAATSGLHEEKWSLWVARNGRVLGRLVLREPVVFSGHVIVSSGVRILTPFFNIFGIITLIGGALYSAWVFWRKGILGHRAAGNVLIAGAAILGGGASAFSRWGMLVYLYLAELSSLILMFIGFLIATRSTRPAATPAPPVGHAS